MPPKCIYVGMIVALRFDICWKWKNEKPLTLLLKDLRFMQGIENKLVTPQIRMSHFGIRARFSKKNFGIVGSELI